MKDKRILQALDIDARQSASRIAKKTGLSKQAVIYRINNLLKHGVIKKFITFVDSQQLGYTLYFVFFRIRNMKKKDEESALKTLADMPEVSWLVSLRGEWQLLVCLMAKDAHEFNSSLEKVSAVIGKGLVRHDFFIMLDAYQLPYKEVLDAPKESYPTQTRIGKIADTVLKHQDRRILSVLAEDARIPKKVLADRTGLTLETVRHSINKLEQEGIIQAYKPLLDVSKLGYCWHMMLVQFASSSEKDKEQLISFLKNLPEVFYINRSVGNWSLSVEFHHKDLEDFNATHDLIMERFEDLISEHSVLQVLKEHKCVFVPGKELLH